VPPPTGSAPAAAPRFAALHVPDYRRYFVAALLAMTADSVEHVISYWVIFLKFHSPALAGFAVISPRLRGRVVGLFNTAVLGLRAGSGVTVGVLGAAIGVYGSLALSAAAVVLIAAALVIRESARPGVEERAPGV
jgi:hypothetical protein